MNGSHRLDVFKRDALGFFSKRDDQSSMDVKWYAGTVLKCATCPLMMFEAAGLSPVIVVMLDYSHLAPNERAGLDN